MTRQKDFHEAFHIPCLPCPFAGDDRCNIPGSTCAGRAIAGIPGRYVGDILEAAGVIEPGWELIEKGGEDSDIG